MSKKTLLRISKFLVSYTVVAGCLHLLLGGWSKPLAYAGLLVFLVAYIINSLREVLINKVLFVTYKNELEMLANRMLASVECSFCGKPNGVKFRMDSRNEFTCDHCGKQNLLLVNASTAQITTPLAGTVSFDDKEKAE